MHTGMVYQSDRHNDLEKVERNCSTGGESEPLKLVTRSVARCGRNLCASFEDARFWALKYLNAYSIVSRQNIILYKKR